MTYDQLVTLESIVNEGSFKAASELLHKTQPSLSTAIKKLEQEYGLQLFSRENYRPELTEVGKAFYKKAQTAMESFRELDTFAKELSLDYETELSLIIDAICPLFKISPALEDFFSKRTSLSFELNIDLLDGLTEKILQHHVDFGIGSFRNPSEDIEAVQII
ncbi:MAG: LysR family transcriptional regulator, partial [Bacteriovoracaceae bacterium]|nr:LysR family transcriptional regulator [Bacteriovoracaceae bacterium]